MKKFFIVGISIVVVIIIASGVVLADRRSDSLENSSDRVVETAPESRDQDTQDGDVSVDSQEVIFQASHKTTPVPVKAIYISSWVAATPSLLQKLVDFIDTTEVNAVVLDIKDATGRVSFLVDNPVVSSTGSPENRIKNIRQVLTMLHEKDIYVIGRISTFQDPFLTKVKPHWAIAKKSTGDVWKDRKGLSFLDPANKDVWEYTVALASDSYQIGFDEINFDYIRYPSDGAMDDIDYKLTEKSDGTLATREEMIESFMSFLTRELRTLHPDIVLSADLFGLTTSAKTDMGIGQILERALPYFDYIGPMIYPSHYAKGEYGVAEPARNPAQIVSYALKGAKNKIDTLRADPTISDDVKSRLSYDQIRPWLQDFSIGGVTYTKDMVRDQIQAVYDAGFDSWMMWDPANKYTREAYLSE